MIQFNFAYSEKSRTDVWIATGKRGPARGTVEVNETTLTPEQRTIIAPFLPGHWQGFIGNLTNAIIDLEEYRPEPSTGKYFEPAASLMKFDTAPSLEDILVLMPKMREEYQQAKTEVARLHDQRQAEKAEKEAREREERALLKALQEQQEAAEEALKQQRLAERASWIKEHGSERLRKCQERGYDCDRLYTIERAAMEYPGFTLDYNDSAEWKERKGPSLEALKREEELAALYPNHEVAIVWLKSPASNAPDSDEDSYDFEPREAIALRPPHSVDYLYKARYGMCWLVQDI